MFVVVIDGARRRLVSEADRQAIEVANSERIATQHEAAERAWYTSLRSLGLRLGDVPGEGESLDVVGESHYLEALASIMAALRESDWDREVAVVARLTREPNNRYDRNAVRVAFD